MEYYTARREKLLSYRTIGMNLTMLNEIKQTQRSVYLHDSIYKKLKKQVKLIYGVRSQNNDYLGGKGVSD